MKNTEFKATSLRTIFIISILIVTSASITGFYFAYGYLSTLSSENQSQITPDITSNASASDLKTVQAEIEKYKDVDTKASSMFTSSQDYQNQITKDLKNYATNIGIATGNPSFAQTSSTSSTSGVKTNNVTLAINGPVQFTKLIKFMKSIETNLPKMQISNLSLTPSATSKDLVTVDSLIIEFYTR